MLKNLPEIFFTSLGFSDVLVAFFAWKLAYRECRKNYEITQRVQIENSILQKELNLQAREKELDRRESILNSKEISNHQSERKSQKKPIKK